VSDILARQRQLIGTTAQWAANDLVIGDGEFALERTTTGRVRVKVGNGTATFSALAYASEGWGATAWANSSHVLATEYHNTLAWPIVVAAWAVINGLASTLSLYASPVSGSGFFLISLSQSTESGTFEAVVSGIVPAGWYFKILATGSSPSLHGWNELT
jgi:hypothetical protein